MTSTTTRKYAVNDMVWIPDGPGYGTIVGTSVTPDDPRAEGASGTGPLYLVNEGNVFTDHAEAVYAESELQPWNDIYEAADVLFRNRHHLAPDVLRTLQSIYTCASAARYGQPHETGWLEDAGFYATHDVGQCEADDQPGELDDDAPPFGDPLAPIADLPDDTPWPEARRILAERTGQQPGDAPGDWFMRELGFAVDAHELTTDLRAEVDAILGEHPISEERYAKAAQLIACRRNTCGGPDSGHDHIA